VKQKTKDNNDKLKENNDKLKEEKHKLEEENNILKKYNSDVKDENETIKKCNKKLKECNNTIENKIRIMKEENDTLKDEIYNTKLNKIEMQSNSDNYLKTLNIIGDLISISTLKIQKGNNKKQNLSEDILYDLSDHILKMNKYFAFIKNDYKKYYQKREYFRHDVCIETIKDTQKEIYFLVDNQMNNIKNLIYYISSSDKPVFECCNYITNIRSILNSISELYERHLTKNQKFKNRQERSQDQ